MADNFKMSTEKKGGDWIVIRMSGDFDGMSAWELIHKMHEFSGQYYLVEVDTSGVTEMVPFGYKTFAVNVKSLKKSPSTFVVTGDFAPYLSDSLMVEAQRAVA